MSYKAKVARGFSRAAGSYDHYATLQSRVASALYAKLPEAAFRQPILDLGCGTGALSRLCARDGYNTPIFALDIAEKMCAQAGGLPLVADMEALPIDAATIPTIYSSMALQWAENSQAALNECRRVLKKQGVLMASIVLPGSLKEVAAAFGPARLNRLYSAVEWQDFCAEAGFGHVEWSEASIVQHYPNLESVLASIRRIGASRKARVTPLTRSQLAHARAHYPSGPKGLPLSWQIGYITARV